MRASFESRLTRVVQFRSCVICLHVRDPRRLLRLIIQRVLFQRLLHTQQRLVVGNDVCHTTGEPVQAVKVQVAVTGRGVTTLFNNSGSLKRTLNSAGS